MNIVKLDFPNSQTINWKPLDISKVNFIIVHHTACKIADPYDINKWHLVDNGWRGGFGYGEYIRKDGTVYIGRGDNIGAHAKGYNEISLGICLEGDFSKEFITAEQQRSLIERLKYHKNRLKSVKSIIGHRDVNDTDCPGKNLILSDILKEVDKVEEMTVVKALNILQEKGVISTTEYWLKAVDVTKYLDKLIINMANKVK